MPVPEEVKGELEQDRYRLAQLHRFQQSSRTVERPDGDVVVALSEVRKSRSDDAGLTLVHQARNGYPVASGSKSGLGE